MRKWREVSTGEWECWVGIKKLMTVKAEPGYYLWTLWEEHVDCLDGEITRTFVPHYTGTCKKLKTAQRTVEGYLS